MRTESANLQNGSGRDGRRQRQSAGQRRRSRSGSFWTDAEDTILQEAYPDYGLARRRLPHRNLASLKHRAARLGVLRRRHVWTQREVRRLADLVAANASNLDLVAAFPNLRLRQVLAKIGHLKLPP